MRYFSNGYTTCAKVGGGNLDDGIRVVCRLFPSSESCHNRKGRRKRRKKKRLVPSCLVVSTMEETKKAERGKEEEDDDEDFACCVLVGKMLPPKEPPFFFPSSLLYVHTAVRPEMILLLLPLNNLKPPYFCRQNQKYTQMIFWQPWERSKKKPLVWIR